MTEKKLETTVDRVYQGVYQAISKRSLRPGMKLGDASLAELFNVSRTSVRAALRRMSASTVRASAICGRAESSTRSARVRAAVNLSTSDFGRVGDFAVASSDESPASGETSDSTARSLRMIDLYSSAV